ncbi:MAG: hypothetical protein PUK59_06690 [Actinomycetaceae bacterium]|nr:hypothetical protein [Actinomycetaceae bacterium]MDY5855021.1 hypothetical protein [Arcanobacterium sp.]
MPNFHDHESNHTYHNDRRHSQSSGSQHSHSQDSGSSQRAERDQWHSSRGEDSSGGRGSYRRDDRRGGYQGRDDSRGGYRRDDDRRGGYRGRDDDRRGFRSRDDDWRGSRDRDDRRSESRSRGERPDDGMRNLRGGEEKRARAKELQYDIPESITADMLPEQTYKHLRGLNATNAEIVARHLAYAGEMMDIDPEVAYEHAKAAYARAARIDIVREAVGIAAYVTGRYSEALTELRAYRRFSNDYSHVAIEADAERGLGRSEKALRFISEIPLDRLDAQAKVELAIVTSGAKADVGDSESGLNLMQKILVENLDPELAARVELVKAQRLEELGRLDEAQDIRSQWEPVYEGADEDADMLLDLDDVLDDVTEAPQLSPDSAVDEEPESDADAEVDPPSELEDEVGTQLPSELLALSADDAADGGADETEGSELDQDDQNELSGPRGDTDPRGGIEPRIDSDPRSETEKSEDAEDIEASEEAVAETSEADASAESAQVSLLDELQEELGDAFDLSEWGEEFEDVAPATYSDLGVKDGFADTDAGVTDNADSVADRAEEADRDEEGEQR